MDMERFKEELKRGNGPNGEKAWKIVEDWYAREGHSRRLSLHDLHDLSKSIASALEAASAPRQDGELRKALEEMIDYAIEYYDHYCEMWGKYRTEQQGLILGRIERAKAFLASNAEKRKD